MKFPVFSSMLLLALLLSSCSRQIDGPSAQAEPIEALPEHLIYLYSAELGEEPDLAQRQLFANTRRWEPGRTLKVCFFGGNDVVASLVRDAASEWNQYSAVKFDFGPSGRFFNCLDPSAGYFQIRVGFGSRGYWSAVGNDSELRIEARSPSMNLEGLNRRYSPGAATPETVLAQADRYHVATIKHEFGHALALLHEQQNPTLGCHEEIRWEGPGNVYEYFAGPPNHWSPDLVKRNLGFVGDWDPDYVQGDSDPQSIMMYSLPPQIFKRGAASPCRVGVNYAVSAKDRQVVAKIYPAMSVVAATSINEINLQAAKVQPIAAVATSVEVADIKERILTDLESDDRYVRRNARARLADLITKFPDTVTTDVVNEAQAGSYRLQLGTAIGINNSDPGVRLAPEARSTLSKLASTTNDPVLKRELGLAIKK